VGIEEVPGRSQQQGGDDERDDRQSHEAEHVTTVRGLSERPKRLN
jgi:hypothetical protein